ncbi:hypothetical protein [Kribbella deserti]|uniref:Uncharacterized protein n=1 Tax=Kribbella deserti TaxID=1926257 RepID=A0ABV6QN46_9ACTN
MKKIWKTTGLMAAAVLDLASRGKIIAAARIRDPAIPTPVRLPR